MSTPALERIRSEALSLPESERADLVRSLISSLDGSPEVDIDAAWESEILRRVSAIEAGTSTSVDRAELRRRMRQRLAGG